MSVIDIRTRQTVESREPTDAERIEKFVVDTADRMWIDALKIQAIGGLDAALRMLGKLADELRHQGKK